MLCKTTGAKARQGKARRTKQTLDRVDISAVTTLHPDNVALIARLQRRDGEALVATDGWWRRHDLLKHGHLVDDCQSCIAGGARKEARWVSGRAATPGGTDASLHVQASHLKKVRSGSADPCCTLDGMRPGNNNYLQNSSVGLDAMCLALLVHCTRQAVHS